MPDKDPEKMVTATAKAMALADVKAGTPRVVAHYVDDARQVLIRPVAKMHTSDSPNARLIA